MPFEVVFDPLAEDELRRSRAFDQRIIANAIEKHLRDQPLTPTKKRKQLPGVQASFAHLTPLWELRVGEYRVFYDVDAENSRVNVRAVRRKLPTQRTEDLL